MTVWQPGMRCVCIVDAPSEWAAVAFKASYPRKGEVVTVRAVNVWPFNVLLRFEEHFNERLTEPGWVEPGFESEWFRPLSETRLDQFRAHLAPTPREKVSA